MIQSEMHMEDADIFVACDVDDVNLIENIKMFEEISEERGIKIVVCGCGGTGLYGTTLGARDKLNYCIDKTVTHESRIREIKKSFDDDMFLINKPIDLEELTNFKKPSHRRDYIYHP